MQRHEVTGVQLAYTGIAPSDGGSASALSFLPAGTGTFDIAITGNTIGLVGAPRSGNENFFGIAGDIQDSPTVRVNVSNNIIRNTALNGIFIQTRDPSAVAGFVDTDLTVRSNTVGPISDDDDFPFGAGPNQAETHATRIESRNDSDLCLDISAEQQRRTRWQPGLPGPAARHLDLQARAVGSEHQRPRHRGSLHHRAEQSARGADGAGDGRDDVYGGRRRNVPKPAGALVRKLARRHCRQE